jgi:hypothetical protein
VGGTVVLGGPTQPGFAAYFASGRRTARSFRPKQAAAALGLLGLPDAAAATVRAAIALASPGSPSA